MKGRMKILPGSLLKERGRKYDCRTSTHDFRTSDGSHGEGIRERPLHYGRDDIAASDIAASMRTVPKQTTPWKECTIVPNEALSFPPVYKATTHF